MKKITYSLKTYGIWLAVTAIILAMLSQYGDYRWDNYVHPFWFFILLGVTGVQWVALAYVYKFEKDGPQSILKRYHFAKMVKLFVFLVLLAIYTFSATDKTLAFSFLVDFLIYYSVLFGVETLYVQRWFKSLSEQNNNREDSEVNEVK